MSLKEDVERDIRKFFKDIESQLPEGQRKTLMLLFDKYMHLSSIPIKFDKRDFEMIKSIAITKFKNSHFPKKFKNSYSEISPVEAPNYCLVEATIAYLYSKDCIKKMPIFDLEEHDG